MATIIEWKSNLTLGLPRLDAQHREMAALLNRLAESDAHHERIDLLRNLHRKSRAHFDEEEALMREMGYPRLVHHQREHTMLTAELKSFTHRLEAGNERLDRNVLAELKVWFIAHITSSDRPMADYCRKYYRDCAVV